MKTKLLVLIIASMAFFSLSNAQKQDVISDRLAALTQKSDTESYSVWIFFTDKGNNINSKIQAARKALPANVVKRRMKNMTTDKITNYKDVPVKSEYISKTLPFVTKQRHSSKWLNAISAEVKSENLNKIAQLAFVKKIDIVHKSKITIPQNNEANAPANIKESRYTYDYGSSLTQNEQINIPAAHDLGYTGNGIVICVMDAGFNNLEHPAFSNMNIIATYDFVNDDENVDDQADEGSGDHGTQTLSSLGGFEQGAIIGPAFGADFILAKTENTDSETPVEEDHWIAAMEWAADNYSPDITSTSLGYIDFDDGSGYSPSELDGNTAIITIGADIAASYGILVINSAGNSGGGTTTIGAPADGDSVLAVGAVDSNGDRVYFSSVGPTADGRIKPEVMAMGSGVTVAVPGSGSGTTTNSGTSFSCPITAGGAGVLMEMVPEATNMQIFNALKMSADNADNPNNEYGWGIINIMAAYEYLRLPSISHQELSDTDDFTGPYTVTAEITSLSDLTAGSQLLYYRAEGGNWTAIEMTENNTDIFTAEIPGTGSPETYQYYIETENQYETVTLPANAPTQFFEFSTLTDTQAPVIEHTPIAEYYVNLWGQAQINCTLSDNLGIDTQNSYVEWFINEEAQENAPIIFVDNNEYQAPLGNNITETGDEIEYKIVVRDNAQTPNTSIFPASGLQSFLIVDIIGFEQNQFSHNWEFPDYSWFTSSPGSQSTNFSAQSADINDSESSTMTISFQTEETGNISFDKKVSGEENWDYLRFFINNEQADEWSGEWPWAQETYTIIPGNYTISWVYDKDGSISNGSDCAWIDNITLPEQTISLENKRIHENSFSLYPNPVTEKLHIVTPEDAQNMKIEIFNISGKKVFENDKVTNTVDVSNFYRGFYIIKLSSENEIQTQKFVIQ
ncbi:MAG: S8 family peptidase [Bacteroidota bacterium]|nr:S8 family peptidase [Bacteroidota bacterium]